MLSVLASGPLEDVPDHNPSITARRNINNGKLYIRRHLEWLQLVVKTIDKTSSQRKISYRVIQLLEIREPSIKLGTVQGRGNVEPTAYFVLNQCVKHLTVCMNVQLKLEVLLDSFDQGHNETS